MLRMGISSLKNMLDIIKMYLFNIFVKDLEKINDKEDIEKKTRKVVDLDFFECIPQLVQFALLKSCTMEQMWNPKCLYESKKSKTAITIFNYV